MTTPGKLPPTPDLPVEKIEAMSPPDRHDYLMRKANEEGFGPDSGLFGYIKQAFARWGAENQDQQIGDKNVKAATTGRDVDYVQGLHAPNADYKGNEHTQLKAFLDNNLSVDQVSNVSRAYHGVHEVFDKFSKTMTTAVNSSKGTWEGSAAENAQQYFTSLSKWSDANAQNAKLASETIYEQGQAASTAKNSMPAPIPFSWTDEFKGWVTSNPLNLADNVDKSLQKQKDSQAAHDEAASVMSTYDKSLYEAASKQPAFAPPPSFSTGGGTGDPNGGGDKNGINLPSGANNPGSSVNLPGGGASTQGFLQGGGGPLGSGAAAHFSGPGSTTGAGLVPSGTTPSSFTPGSIQGGGSSNPNQSLGGMPPMSPMPMGGMTNFGGDEAYNSKVGGGSGRGGGGGFGPGGSGAGNATGAGAASGAARPGGIGAAESAAGRGMGGLGSGGAGGRGGMGPGGGMARGQKGEGDEDTEHSRPTYLVEGDPDEVFGTDLRTAPPVIGE
ncbi:hypothetical protein DMA12_46395 [Amycolatopsis balhimycina DSM 5908]|uniref:PPE domain-containing protein n=1 Tax=Amycolatopsis balhimycina DSM 5908 TaxID=1081091 RepID=A0A428VVL6_AMYBA|nr:hypothetical protein [Amycolatopsis balhimycina]RSM34890.1 hypothetical protein DMA12_46395 [Amycolatopsis balhimycina DSM 5908]